MRKESSTVQKCKRQMATLGFDSQLAYHRVKLILKIYRDVVWVLSERVEELHEYAWELGAQDADTGLIYLQSFAPDMDLQEFEERVCCVMENRMLVDVIDRALLRLKRYPDRGELYYEILTKQFKRVHPSKKQPVASCIAMTPPGIMILPSSHSPHRNGDQAMRAADRDPAGGESPMTR